MCPYGNLNISLTYAFSKYLLNASYVPGSLLSRRGDSKVAKIQYLPSRSLQLKKKGFETHKRNDRS